MATIPSPKECMVKKANQKLFDDIYKLFEFWDINMWRDTANSELADIWCETIEQFDPVVYSEKTIKREFVNKIMERLVDYNGK